MKRQVLGVLAAGFALATGQFSRGAAPSVTVEPFVGWNRYSGWDNGPCQMGIPVEGLVMQKEVL